jgi:hypothetical protein
LLNPIRMRIAFLVALVLVLAGAFIVVRGFVRSRQPPASGANPYHGLREQVLALKPADLGLTPADLAEPWGVVMDLGMDRGTASIVCLRDGTVSMYLSGGGGTVGAGARDSVRKAAIAFIAEASRHTQPMTATVDHPLPAAGRVRFYVHVGAELLTWEGVVNELIGGGDPQSPLFIAGNEVITQLRLAGEL